MSRRCSSAELRGRDANGTRTRTSHLDGVVHYSDFAMAPLFLRSGGWGRTSISGLTVRRPAIERHQTEDAALCRLSGPGARLAFVAGAGFEPASQAYEARKVTELLQPAVTHPGLEPGRSCLKGRWL